MSTPGETARYGTETWPGFVAIGIASVGLALGFGASSEPELARLGMILATGVAPALLVIVLARWCVRTRRVPVPGAVAAAAVGVSAFGLGALAAASWSEGFALADAGRPSTLFADLFLTFLVASWVLGAAAVFLALVALLRRPALSRTRRALLAALVAAFTAPAIGLSFVSPGTSVIAGVAVTVLVLVVGAPRAPRGGGRSAATTSPLPAPLAAPQPVGRGPEALAWLSAVLGAAAVAFALSGSTWPAPLGPGLDGTSAMAWGIAAGFVGALPLLLGVALVLDRRRPAHTPTWAVRVPAALLAAALLAAGAFSANNALTDGAGSLLGWNLAGLSLLLYGLAIALVAFASLRLAGSRRAQVAALIGFGATVLTGALILYLPFASPLIAVLLAIVVFPRINRPRPALGSAAPGVG